MRISINVTNYPINGAHYQLTHPTCYPPPATRPHPPILIGGAGEKRALDTGEDRHAHRRDGHVTPICHAGCQKTGGPEPGPEREPGASAGRPAALRGRAMAWPR